MSNILLVDDEQYLLTLGERTLGSLGGIETAGSGEAAIARINHETGQPIDVIVTDFEMPEKNGIDVVMAAVKKGIALVILHSGSPGVIPFGELGIDLDTYPNPAQFVVVIREKTKIIICTQKKNFALVKKLIKDLEARVEGEGKVG